MFLKGQYVEQSTLIGMGWLGVAIEAEVEEWEDLFKDIYSKTPLEDEKKYI